MALPPPPPPKTPPRFVPTLTEVVQLPGDAVPARPVPGASPRTTVMSPSVLSSARSAASMEHPAARHPGGAAPVAERAAAAPLPRPHFPLQGAAASAAAARIDPAAAGGVPTASARARQPAMTRPLPEGMEEYMVHRVMQRVDVVLDQRLREAIATVVQEQTRSVLPRLREEIESVVRHAVYEAVADELASGAASVPKG